MNVLTDRPYATVHHFWMGVKHLPHTERMKRLTEFLHFMRIHKMIVSFYVIKDPNKPAAGITISGANQTISIPLSVV